MASQKPDVLRVLKRKFPQGILAISRRRYQVSGDGINCGPWTVALLEYLARHNGALPNSGAIHIGTRRTRDRVLMTGQH